jgi:hypothetical protein
MEDISNLNKLYDQIISEYDTIEKNKLLKRYINILTFELNNANELNKSLTCKIINNCNHEYKPDHSYFNPGGTIYVCTKCDSMI